jgi:hypothetical protein
MEIEKSKNQTYMQFKEAQYPGYTLKGSKALEKELDQTRKHIEARKEKFYQNEKKFGKWSKEANAVANLYDEAYEKYNTLKKAMTSGSAFTNLSVDDQPFHSTSLDFSLGDFAGGRVVLDANRARVPMDKYNDDTIAETVPEGGSSTAKDLLDSLTLLLTDTDEAIIFDDILQIGVSPYNDDKEVMDQAIEFAHSQHFINAENIKALEILIASKSALSVSAESVQDTINANLSGKAKRNAVIITNHSGFAELDIDVNGVAQVTKDPTTGNMIYKHKYTVIEIPDAILPDLDAGSPIIAGDIANVLRFFLIRDDSLFKDDIYPYIVADRRIKKEIIALTTKCDAAYIVGYLN